MAKTFSSKKERKTRSHMNDPFARSDATAARRVLRDCHISLQRYQSALEGVDRRLAWVTVVTLLRTVGHVLTKIDGARSNYLRAAIDTAWVNVRAGGIEHEIFHDFVERERNSILKEYRIGNTRVEPLEVATSDVDRLLIGTRLLRPAQALREAIRWWEILLERIETDADHRLAEDKTTPRVKKVSKSRRKR